LVLKHRQGKNHRMRIIVFIGSPIEDDEKEVCWTMLLLLPLICVVRNYVE